MWVRVFLTSLLVLPVIRGIRAEEEEATSDFYQCVPGIGNNPGGECKTNIQINDGCKLSNVTSVESQSKIYKNFVIMDCQVEFLQGKS